MNNLIVTLKSWNVENAEKLKLNDKYNNWEIISNREEFTSENVHKINPKYIFVPHWSWKIPKEIFGKYETVIFHPTDLPYGRGGTPIQNLIIRGIYDTKISAIKAVEEMDAGPVYGKRNFNIEEGTVEDILKNASQIYFNDLIPEIVRDCSIPVEQEGEIVKFKRRRSEESKIIPFLETKPNQKQIYDFIRMLDGEGYPPAYLDYLGNKFEISNAKMSPKGLEAKITKK